MDETKPLERVTVNPANLGGEPIMRAHRLAVDHVFVILAAGDSHETILAGYPWREREDIRAWLVYARRLVEAASASNHCTECEFLKRSTCQELPTAQSEVFG